MTLDDALPTFYAESRELLVQMESDLLGLSTTSDRADRVNAIFRAAHTIKGSAGLFGFAAIVQFTHVLESVLDRVREGRVEIDDRLVTLLLRCGDHVATLLDAAETGASMPDSVDPGVALIAELNSRLGDKSEVRSDPGAEAPRDLGKQPARRFDIAVRFGRDVLRNGMDPLSILRYLRKLGSLDAIATRTERLPSLEALDAESCYLDLDFSISTQAGREEIDGAFEFVRDDCELRIAEFTGAAQSEAPTAAPALAPSISPAADGSKSAAAATSIRIDASKLDRLIDLVGELITASAGARIAGLRTPTAELIEAHSHLETLVGELRDSALALRTVRIGATFSRFQRVVHDVSAELGKDIALVTGGEDTELDKTIVEKIADPLTHLVRNAIDHGIEAADLRVSRGKPPRGTVTLNAYHESGHVVIEVSDDGGGLDRDRILAKAVERGLLAEDHVPSEREIFNLIFEPGFSTASAVTNLSGRGVGMDVVKRNINALRGSVEISSRPEQGTRISIRLPLTLAIIDGFHVTVDRSVFVAPLEAIEECVAFAPASDHAFVDLRGSVLPFVRLRELFGIGGRAAGRENLVVMRHESRRFGLVVDRLLGEAQTVIKPLAAPLTALPGITGTSILGSGDVALILDVPMLLDRASARAGQPSETPAA